MQDLKLAILIDADNISPKYVKVILDEAASFGVAACKRIYGDWSDVRLKSWKDALLNNSIIPIQQYSYTTGKNATDSAMIIDAMDLLYSGNLDGFCIVSSDSDFTRLAARLREAGKLVIGMGESKALGPFVKACDQFKYLDLILDHGEADSAPAVPAAEAGARAAAGDDTAINRESIGRIIDGMIDEMDDGTGWVRTSRVGDQLIKRYPDFDVPLPNHYDCGCLLYDVDSQNVQAGGSGAGCSAAVLCAWVLPRLFDGRFKRVLFLSTGALMSQTTFLQGETIPGIAHCVELGGLV